MTTTYGRRPCVLYKVAYLKFVQGTAYNVSPICKSEIARVKERLNGGTALLDKHFTATILWYGRQLYMFIKAIHTNYGVFR